MPVKTHSHKKKNYPKHYAKVYWPYLPLVIIMAGTMWLGSSYVNHSQRGVLAYATNTTASGLLRATNVARQNHGDTLLTANESLNAAAQAKANDMVKRNYWSHTTPDGKAPWNFIDGTTYRYATAGENLAYGFTTSTDTINGWLNSAAHRDNLLNSIFQNVGFGIASSENFQNNGPETVVVALYAAPVEPIVTTTREQGGTLGYTTRSPVYAEPNTHGISKAQTITNGELPWIGFALGLVLGAGLVYLALFHTLNWHKARKKGVGFKIAHPLRDVTILAGVILCVMLIQNVGVIR